MKNSTIIEKYMRSPMHPITVTVIGCGGTGSQLLQGLARINAALIKLDHPGLKITAWDPDEVSQSNIARQLFAKQEIGMNKAVAIITRINRFFQTSWTGIPGKFNFNEEGTNIYFTCTDTVKSRTDFSKHILRQKKGNESRHNKKRYYWIDCGNTKNKGQVWLSSLPYSDNKLPTLYEVYHTPEEDNSTPSCSVAEALEKQDLFINTIVVNSACSLFWQLFRKAYITEQGAFINLENGINIKSIPIKTSSN